MGNRLYVNIGSAGNVDAPAGPTAPPATRAMIRRFDLGNLPAGGYLASAGEVFASGLRNEVGLALDAQGRIWGVENGRDDLRSGGDAMMYNDNPGEEVNSYPAAAVATTAIRSAGAKAPGPELARRDPERSISIPISPEGSPNRVARIRMSSCPRLS